tara:strand:- start:657 stop:1265 length:609 start_codon:yes stop_codon:yes gene_type:complete
MFWSTDEFFRVPGVVDSVADMMGTRLADVLPACAARERELIHRKVMETGMPESHYQLSSDSRVLCSVFPLDEKAFGHRGIFAVVKDARLEPRTVPLKRFPVLKTPVFKQLNVLSTRELEVLYHIGVGSTTHEIALQMNRADKTIEHHVNSIHGKLETHTRSQLVRFASERGIQAFSIEEWSSIVEGAQQVRRELNRAALQIA